MFRKSIKNYFQCLKYFFIPLGTMFLGLLAGVSVLVPGVVSAVNSLVEGISLLSARVELDFTALWSELREIINGLDWDDPVSSMQTMLSVEWLNDTLTHSLNSVLGENISFFSDKMNELISTFVSEIVGCVSVFVFIFSIGFVIGFVLTKLFVRRNIAKRTIWKWFLTNITNAVLTVIMVISGTLFFAIWQPSAFISLLFILIISSIVSLLEAYLVYGRKKVNLCEIVNIKNVFKNITANILIFIISIIFIVITVRINVLMGIFVGLTIIEIAMCVINMNAESYVQGLLGKDRILKK